MFDTKPGLINDIRSRFAHVDTCPIQGKRIFFENAGGALTLKSVIETSKAYAAIPDNQGRDNAMSQELSRVITKARADAKVFLNAHEGQVFIGESGTEVLFRIITTAIIETGAGDVLGTTLEHPASRSACQRWAKIAGKRYILVPHDNATGSVDADAYTRLVTPETRVATIVHTSPVTGMGVDVEAISRAIRAVAPDCFIIVDGIQHAAHGALNVRKYNIDAYAISPYKMFSRHGYGIGWLSERLSLLPHNSLTGTPPENWELGTRDTGSYATFSNVIDYFDWLGSQFTPSTDRREKLEAAGKAIHAHEKDLSDAMLYGTGNMKGLADLPHLQIIGGIDNPRREGLVALNVDGIKAGDVVARLNDAGIRVHIRKADHYSGNVLEPLGLQACVRISLCHYNTQNEIAAFLEAMRDITASV